MAVEQRRSFIEPLNELITVSRQCELVGLARSSWYYEPVENERDETMMKMIDEIYTKHPFLGARKIALDLTAMGCPAGRTRVGRLMKVMGVAAVYQKPRLSAPCEAAKKYPYLLAGIKVSEPNHVWCADITYVRMRRGFAYLVAVMDWFSRYVLSWRLSVFMDASFCVEALEGAFAAGAPHIFNTDQGAQFTSDAFTGVLLKREVRISMDGRGRYLDNIFIERLWRSVKYEEVYLKDYSDVWEAERELDGYFSYYNQERRHQSLGYQTPAAVYWN